jgi:hydrogenase-4 component F
MPITGGLFAMGLLALLGLPPFGLFISELLLFRAGFLAGHPWLMGFVLALLAMAFVSMIAHLNRMLYGVPPAAIPAGERWSATPILAAVCLVVLVVFCLALPGPVRELLDGGVAVIAP